MNFMALIEMNSKNRILKNFFKAVAIVVLSSLPYIHDVITIKGEGLQGWVPDWGLQNFLMDADGYILGFSSYRVFLYTILLHIFAHIGWVGWFFDAKGKLYRPFLLVPVTLSLYQVLIIFLDFRGSPLNQPDIKLYFTLVFSLLLAINFYFNNKKLINYSLKITPKKPVEEQDTIN